MNGLLDERRRVVHDAIINSDRELTLQFLHPFFNLSRRRQRVGSRQLENRQPHARQTVHFRDLVILQRTQFDAAHITQADDLAGRQRVSRFAMCRLHNDIAELFGFFQSAERAHGELELLPIRNRRAANLSGGNLHVLTADRRDHVARRQVTGGHFVGIQPHAHAVVALAE